MKTVTIQTVTSKVEVPQYQRRMLVSGRFYTAHIIVKAGVASWVRYSY